MVREIWLRTWQIGAESESNHKAHLVKETSLRVMGRLG